MQGEDQLTQDLCGHIMTESPKWRGLEQARRSLDKCTAGGADDWGCASVGDGADLLDVLFAAGAAADLEVVAEGESGIF